MEELHIQYRTALENVSAYIIAIQSNDDSCIFCITVINILSSYLLTYINRTLDFITSIQCSYYFLMAHKHFVLLLIARRQATPVLNSLNVSMKLRILI